MEEIKQAVSAFKEKNGNDSFSNKDLLMYIVHRLDKLPCVAHVTMIASNRIRTKILLWAYPIGVAILGLIIAIK